VVINFGEPVCRRRRRRRRRFFIVVSQRGSVLFCLRSCFWAIIIVEFDVQKLADFNFHQVCNWRIRLQKTRISLCPIAVFFFFSNPRCNPRCWIGGNWHHSSSNNLDQHQTKQQR
jgi:hypothetical protein